MRFSFPKVSQAYTDYGFYAYGSLVTFCSNSTVMYSRYGPVRNLIELPLFDRVVGNMVCQRVRFL